MGLFGLNIEKLKEKKNVEGLIKALNSKKDGKIRQAAAEALGELGDTCAIEPLIEALGGEDKDVRQAATEALGKIGEPAVKPLIAALKQGLERGKGRLRNIIAEVLGKIGEPAVEPLITVLKDIERYKRMDAADALGKIGDPRAVEPLIAVLKDEYVNVRSNAAKALGKIGDPRAVEPLIAAFKNEEKDVVWAVAEALGKIGDSRAVDPLIEVLKKDIPSLLDGDGKRDNYYYLANENIVKVLNSLGWSPDRSKAEAWLCVVNLIDSIKYRKDMKTLQSWYAETIAHGSLVVEPLIAALDYSYGNLYFEAGSILYGNCCVLAADALGEIGDTRAVNVLLYYLREAKPGFTPHSPAKQKFIISVVEALGKIGTHNSLDCLNTAANYSFMSESFYKAVEETKSKILNKRDKAKNERDKSDKAGIIQGIKREAVHLGNTDSGLKMALSPLLNALEHDLTDSYSSLALVTTQLADSLEAIGTVDAITIYKLRQINEKLIKLSS